MRIAFILHRFPVVSETFILSQITGLIDLGHDVTIYSERTPDSETVVHPEVEKYDLRGRVVYLDTQMPAESGIWSIPVWPITGETWPPGAESPVMNYDRILNAVPALQQCLAAHPSLTIQLLDPGQYGQQAATLESLYHLHTFMQHPTDCDVIHAHFGHIANNYRFLKTLWQVPMVVSFHGYDFSTFPREHGRDVYARLFSETDIVTAVSRYALNRIEQLGCPASKLTVLRMGVDLKAYPFRPRKVRRDEPVRLLTIGRLVEKKGIEFILRAAAQVRGDHPNLRCDIIGDGPLRPQLEQLIRELGMQAMVTLHGARDGSFVREMMDQAHLFALPSVTASNGDEEGIPVSLMEAQASGLPVLSTRHSGIPELVADGSSGFLVAERDVQELAGRLSHLLEHPELWPRMGAEGRKIVEANFDTRVLCGELIQLYERAVTRPGAAPGMGQ